MGWSVCLTCDTCGVDKFGGDEREVESAAVAGGWAESAHGWSCPDCLSQYVTVCFSVKLTSEQIAQLSIVDGGSVELNDESFILLTNAAKNSQSEFAVAEIGCPEWAEHAGADPSLWEA
jgi:hypothetical protein